MSSLNSILITGGAGYVGSVLTNNLVKQNYDVTVVDSLVFFASVNQPESITDINSFFSDSSIDGSIW